MICLRSHSPLAEASAPVVKKSRHLLMCARLSLVKLWGVRMRNAGIILKLLRRMRHNLLVA